MSTVRRSRSVLQAERSAQPAAAQLTDVASTQEDAVVEAGLARAWRRRRRNRALIRRGLTVLIGAAILLLWQLIVVVGNVSPYILPGPTTIAQRVWQGLGTGPESFWNDIWTTGLELLVAYAIVIVVGTLLGMLLAQWDLLEHLAYPYVFIFQVIPKIAIAPLLILWCGFGLKAMVAVGAVITLFPMLVNSMAGFKSVPTENVQMFRGLCASPIRTFFKLKLPTALPYLFAGFDLCLVYSLMGVVLAEFIGGQKGLGVRILAYNTNVDVSGEFAVIVVLSAMSLILHMVLNVLRHRVLFWTPSEIARRAE